MKKTVPELETLAEHVGQFIEYWGFKKIHGRIWTFLYVSKEPMDATELRMRLKVSKALISMSLSDLLEYEVIEDLGKGPRGTTVFRANPNVSQVIIGVLRKRERKMIGQVVTAQRLMQSIPAAEQEDVGIDSKRVESLGEMIETARAGLEFLIQAGPIDPAIVQALAGVKPRT